MTYTVIEDFIQIVYPYAHMAGILAISLQAHLQSVNASALVS